MTFDEGRKQALLDDFREDGPLAKACLGAPESGGTESVAAESGLHVALLKLLVALGGHSRDPESLAFYLDLLSRIPAGTNGLDLVRSWYAAIWELPGVGIASGIKSTAAYADASAVIALVSDSRSHPVAPQEWRQARAALSAIGENIAPAEPVLAMAWDLDRVPGASADVFYGWQSATTLQIEQRLGWTIADADRLRPAFEEFSKHALAVAGPPDKDDDGWMSRYSAALETCWADRSDLSGLKQRYDAVNAAVADDRAAVTAAARKALIECAKATKADSI